MLSIELLCDLIHASKYKSIDQSWLVLKFFSYALEKGLALWFRHVEAYARYFVSCWVHFWFLPSPPNLKIRRTSRILIRLRLQFIRFRSDIVFWVILFGFEMISGWVWGLIFAKEWVKVESLPHSNYQVNKIIIETSRTLTLLKGIIWLDFMAF